MSVEPWKRVDPTTPHPIGHRVLVTKTFILPDGNTHEFETYDHEGREYAGCVALTTDNQVIISRQFRPGQEVIMDEIPGGGIEEGEDPATAAARELMEETGYQAGELTSLGFIYKDAYNNATWHYFLATNCQPHPGGQHLDDHEYVEMALISIDEFLDNARNGRMTDVEAVFLAYEHLKAAQS